MQKIMIFGASSAIAEETARIFATKNKDLVLVARSNEKLEVMKADLSIRGAKSVNCICLDATDFKSYDQLFEGELPDSLLICHGSLTDEDKARTDANYLSREVEVNLTSYLAAINLFVGKVLESGKKVNIAAIGSVAGDRSRQSNYLYGTCKNAVAFFLEGVQHKLHANGSKVTIIKPGFTDTPMTAHLEQGPLFVKPQVVAKDIAKALEKGTRSIYTPWFWKYIMLIIRMVPKFVFYKTKL
jgi:short-subunit dehydrogenase